MENNQSISTGEGLGSHGSVFSALAIHAKTLQTQIA